MANPLPNEQALYARIKDEKIRVHPVVWDTMYHYLGDYLSAISFLCAFYVDVKEPMPVEDAQKVIAYTKKIMAVVSQILHPEKATQNSDILGQIDSAERKLHPLIYEFFTHYIPNDINCINFRISYYLDPADEQPVPLEEIHKVLSYISSMRGFLENLREATNHGKGYQERKDAS